MCGENSQNFTISDCYQYQEFGDVITRQLRKQLCGREKGKGREFTAREEFRELKSRQLTKQQQRVKERNGSG